MPRPRRTRATPGKSPGKSVETLRHEEDTRTNIPTAEYQSMVREDTEAPLRVAYQRRNRDLDPQLVCGGARTSRTWPTWWSTCRPSTFKKKSTPRRSSPI